MEHIDNKSKKWSLSVKPSHKSRGLITVDCVGRVRAAECRWQRRPPSVCLSVEEGFMSSSWHSLLLLMLLLPHLGPGRCLTPGFSEEPLGMATIHM